MSQQDPFADSNSTPPPSNNPGGYQQGGYTPGGYQEAVPNSTAALVLGIISIATCWLYGVPGIICGIIALILANNGSKAYNANPEKYTASSMNNLKAGRICGIIGLILSGLFIIYLVVVFVFIASSGLGSYSRYY